MSTLIEEFVRRYVREQDFYARVAELCGRHVERALKDESVRAITTWRAKRPDRLLRKLEERDRRRSERYKSEQEVYDDIPDLAGVRIALYFPGDRERVNSLIDERFALVHTRVFPQAPQQETQSRRHGKRFAGYGAAHYRVRMREESLGADEKRYADGRCEIQVASVLMHAWAEVEHDLEYKTLSGDVSPAESALLDQINGLVIAGEIALEQLQLATYARNVSASSSGGGGGGGTKMIRDQYDLANWLSGVRNDLADRENVSIGRADIAFRLLELIGETDFGAVESRRGALTRETADGTMAQRLIEAFLIDNQKHVGALQRARMDVAAADADTVAPAGSPLDALALGQFLARWRTLEEALEEVLRGTAGRPRLYPLHRALPEIINENSLSMRMLRRLQVLRNHGVHGTDHRPSAAELFEGIAELDRLVRQLPVDAMDDARRTALQAAITRLFGAPNRKKHGDGHITVKAEPLVPLDDLRAAFVICTVANEASQSDLIADIQLRIGTRTIAIDDLDNRISMDDLEFLHPGEPAKIPGNSTITFGIYFSGVSNAEVEKAGGTVELQLHFASAGEIRANLLVVYPSDAA